MLFLGEIRQRSNYPREQANRPGGCRGKIAEYYRLLADERGIELKVSGRGSVRGDVLSSTERFPICSQMRCATPMKGRQSVSISAQGRVGNGCRGKPW